MRTPGRPFTPEEDTVIVEMAPNHTMQQIADVLERPHSSVLRRMRMLRNAHQIERETLYFRKWLPEEDEELTYLIRQFPLKVVAQKMGRSFHGCRQRLYKLYGGTAYETFRDMPDSQPGLLREEVAKIFGVPSEQIRRWSDQGLIHRAGYAGYVKSSGVSKCLYSPDEVFRLIREGVGRYLVEDMQVGPYRRLAEQIRRQEKEDPWLSPKQVAMLCDRKASTIREFIRDGRIKAERCPGTTREWRVRKSESLAWASSRKDSKLRKAA